MKRWLIQWRLQRASRHCANTPVAELIRRLPPLSTPLGQCPLLALDFETTGLNADRDAIVSMGWAPLQARQLHPGQSGHRLIRIDRPLPDESIKIHGITHSRMQQGEPLCAALHDLIDALTGRWPLVHFAPIEQRFLEQALEHCSGCSLRLPMLDTFALAQRLLRHTPTVPDDLRLANLRQRFHLPLHTLHNAREDAIATGELLLAMLAHEPDWRDRPIGELLTF